MMKKHGSLRKFSGKGIFINLYEQVHGTREIESPALPWHTIQMNTYFPKSWFWKLCLFKLSPHNTIQIPLWWICILSFILRCRDEKWWTASVFSAKEQSLGCSHQPSPSWKTPERTTRTRMGETRVWKKGMKRSKWEGICTAPPVQVNTEPLASHLTIVRFERKMKISVFIALETAKTGRVFNTKNENKC